MKKETLKRFREDLKKLIETQAVGGDVAASIVFVINRTFNEQHLSPQEIVDFVAILAEVETADRIASPAKKYAEPSDDLEELITDLENEKCGQNCDCDCDKQAFIAEDGFPETEMKSPGVFTKEYDDGQH